MYMQDRRFPPKYEIVSELKIPEVLKTNLNNGIEIYFIETANKNISEIIFDFGAGVWNQPQLLIASMTLFMLSEGTKYHNSQQIADIFDFYAAQFDAGASMHSSSVKLTALNKFLPELIKLVAEILKFPDFPKKELNILINKNKQQLILELEEEDTIARNKLEEMIFGNNCPYGWSAKPNDYDKLKPEILKKFYYENFFAQNLKIIVASNDLESIMYLLNENFYDFQSGNVNFEQKSYIPQSGEKFLEIKRKNAMQSAIRTAWKTFDRKHIDYTDLSILDTFLGGYFGSRLMQNIRQKKGYTYSIYSSLNAYKYSGTFEIVSEVQKKNKFKVVDEIKNEILRLQKEQISEEEMSNLRNYMLGSIIRGLDGNFTFARTLHSLLVYDLPLDFLNTYTDRIKTVTPERLRELAVKYLNIDEMFTVIVG